MPFPCGPSSWSDNTHQLTLWSNVLCTWLPFLTQHIVRGRAWQQTTCFWYSFKLGARRPRLQLILKGVLKIWNHAINSVFHSSTPSSTISDAQMRLVHFKGQKALLCPSLCCQGHHFNFHFSLSYPCHWSGCLIAQNQGQLLSRVWKDFGKHHQGCIWSHCSTFSNQCKPWIRVDT